MKDKELKFEDVKVPSHTRLVELGSGLWDWPLVCVYLQLHKKRQKPREEYVT